MKIQIVHSVSGEVIHSPRQNRDLETDMHEHLGARAKALPFFRLMRRRALRLASKELAAASAELRELTR